MVNVPTMQEFLVLAQEVQELKAKMEKLVKALKDANTVLIEELEAIV